MGRLDQMIELAQAPELVARVEAAWERDKAKHRAQSRRYIQQHGRSQSDASRRNRVRRSVDQTWRRHFLRLGLPCQQCGAKTNLELSHKVPVQHDGAWTNENLQWLCHDCHVRYDARVAGMIP